MSVNVIDIFLVLGILLACFFGMRKGLLDSLAGVLVVYLSYYFSNLFAGIMAGSLTFLGDVKTGNIPLLVLALFVFFNLIGAVLLWLLKKVVEIKILGPVDTAGGVIFSGLKFMIFVAALFNIILLFPFSGTFKDWLTESYLMNISSVFFKRTYPIAESTIPQVKTYIDETVMPAVTGEKVETRGDISGDVKTRGDMLGEAKKNSEKMVKAAGALSATLEAIKKELGLNDIDHIDVSKITKTIAVKK